MDYINLNSGMMASPFSNKEDAEKYVNAMRNLVEKFKYTDFIDAIKNFKESSLANSIRRRYDDYDWLPNMHVLTTGSLLKKVR